MALRYRTDGVSFGEFASEYGYNDLDDDLDSGSKKELEDHYLAFNVANIADETGEKASELRRQAKSHISQYNTSLREQRGQKIQQVSPSQQVNAATPTSPAQFTPDVNSPAEDLFNSFVAQAGSTVTEGISAAGIIGNSLSRKISGDDSEFSLQLADYGEKLTQSLNKAFEVDTPNFATKVAGALGSIGGVLATGGVGGGLAKVSTQVALKTVGKKTLSKRVADATTTIGRTIGATGGSVGLAVTEQLDKYIDQLDPDEEITQDKINGLVNVGLAVSALDRIVPTRVLNNSKVFKKVADKFVLGDRAPGRLRSAINTGTAEGATEFLQTIIADAGNEYIADDTSLQEAFDEGIDDLTDALDQGSVGATAGLLLGALLPGRDRSSTSSFNTPTVDSEVVPVTQDSVVPSNIDQTYEFAGDQYTVVEDTLSSDGSEGAILGQRVLPNGQTQSFTIDSSRPEAAPIIQDYISQRDERLAQEATPLDDGQGEIFNYEAESVSPDQSVDSQDNAIAQTPVTTTDTDGKPTSAELKSRQDDIALQRQSPQDIGAVNSIKRKLARNFSSGGLLKDTDDRTKFISAGFTGENNINGVEQAAEFYNSGNRVADVEQREPLYNYRQAVNKDFGKLKPDDVRLLNRAFRGDTQAFESLPDASRQSISSLRDIINGYSGQISVELSSILESTQQRLIRMQERGQTDSQTTKSLADTVSLFQTQLDAVNNNLPTEDNPLGSYYHRTFGVMVDDKLRKLHFNPESKEYSDLHASFSKTILSKNPSLSNDEISELATANIERIKSKINDNVDSPFFNVSKSILSDTSINALRQRVRLAPEMKAFLGEIENPMVQFSASIHQQRLILSGIEFANRIKRLGGDQGWLSESPNTARGLTDTVTSNGNNPGLKFLEGYYAPKFINDGLADFFSVPVQNQTMRQVMSFLSAVKLGKTAGSTGSQIRNLLSFLPIISVNAAIGNPKAVYKGFKAITDIVSNKKSTDDLKLWVKYGAAQDGISIGTLKHLISDITNLDEANFLTANTVDSFKPSAKDKLRRTTNTVLRLYQVSDDLPKIIVFENWRDIISKAEGLDRSDPKVLEMASKRTRDNTPTYSKVPKVFKGLRNVPFTPPYISFPAEMFRISKNFLTDAKKDLESGNPVYQRHAAYRIIAAGATSSAIYNAGEAIGHLAFGETEEERKEFDAVRELSKGQKFTNNDDIQVLRRYDDGAFETFNMSYYNPYDVVSRLLPILFNGEKDIDSRAIEAVVEATSSFISPDVTVSAILRSVKKAQQAQGGITDKGAVFAENLIKGISPTVLNDAKKVYDTAQGSYNRDGSRGTLTRSFNKLAGVSTQRQHPLFIYSGKLDLLNQEINKYKSNRSFSVKDPNSNPDSQAINNQLIKINQLWGTALKDIGILKSLGYSDSQIYKVTDGPLSVKASKSLLEADPFDPRLLDAKFTKLQGVKDKLKQAKFFQGDDAAASLELLQREAYRKYKRD